MWPVAFHSCYSEVARLSGTVPRIAVEAAALTPFGLLPVVVDWRPTDRGCVGDADPLRLSAVVSHTCRISMPVPSRDRRGALGCALAALQCRTCHGKDTTILNARRMRHAYMARYQWVACR